MCRFTARCGKPLSTTSDPLVCGVVVLLLATAAVIDVRTRRIPNALTFVGALVGIGLAATGNVHVSLAQSVVGLVFGMLLMMPGYLFGKTGAGDVKLMGAAGALVGVGRVPAAFLFTAIAGGVIALGFAVARRKVAGTFPYGPAIAVGTTLAAFGFWV